MDERRIHPTTIASARRAPLAASIPRPAKRASTRHSPWRVTAHVRVFGGALNDDERAYVARKLGMKLGKFATSIERVSVRVSDVNGPRGGVDQRCRVKVVLIGEDGREVILGVLGVGEHFGELSLIDDMPRSAHVIAMEETNLLVLRRDDFRRRVEANPAVAWSLLVELARRLRRADAKIHGLALLDVPGRIARLLLDFAEESGTDAIDKPLTHQTIAHMIGASRETVSRTVRDFQNQGLIRVERRRISVANRPALKQLAQTRL